ncbi:MAG TPA: DUF6519 domain-containing protein, partial [Polyangiaceae bacterium]|nr:DUF6519 domain-containing protein [Polyangiaceae bacterium]
MHRQGELALLAPARWRGGRRLRVAFDGLSLSISLDDEHAGHAHTGAPGHAAPSDVLDIVDLEQRATLLRERHLPIGIWVGMGVSGQDRGAGFRGSIESIRIWAGSTDAAPLLVDWRLDEGIGTLAADASGHGHHLQLDYGDRSAHPRWQTRSLSVSPGRFYVDGWVCHSSERTTLSDLPPPDPGAAGSASLVYLDVWERVVTAAEEPSLRDPALGGVDTAARLRLHQRVRCLPVGSDEFVEPGSPRVQRAWQRLLHQHRSGVLRVRSTQPARIRDGYYRIEIHHAGGRAEIGEARGRCRVRALEPGGRQLSVVGASACSWEIGQPCAALDWQTQISALRDQGKTLEVSTPLPDSFGTQEFWLRPLATFKWSRNNASDQWPVQRAEGRSLNVLPVPGRLLEVGDLVEVSDQERRDQGRAGVVSTITQCSDDGQHLVLRDALPPLGRRLLLTRWHGRALVPVKGVWTPLENGLEVQFGGSPNHGAGEGWGFATREADGSLDWPLTSAAPPNDAQPDASATQQRVPAWRPARDGRHHFALLALLQRADSGVSVRDLRRSFVPLTEDTGESAPAPSGRPPSDSVHRPAVETIRHVGRETQIDDGVIHARQLAADAGVVPLGAAILSERALPPPGFEATGQTLRVPHPHPHWHPLPGASPAHAEHVALLEVQSGLLALVPGGRVWLLEAGERRWRAIAEMPAQLRDFGATVVRGERIHIVGGRLGNGAPLSTHWVLERERWTQRAPTTLARAALRLEVLEGRLLALGGLRPALFRRDSSSKHAGHGWWWQREHATASAEAYDEALDAWAPAPSLPLALSDAASVVYDGQLHLIGGRSVPLFGAARLRRDHFELSTSSGKWHRRQSLGNAKAGAGAARLGEALLLVGGETATGVVADVERYVPAHDRWEKSSPLPFARTHAGVAAMLGTLVCAGGETTPAQRDGVWICALETQLFVHRRTGVADLANDRAALERAAATTTSPTSPTPTRPPTVTPAKPTPTTPTATATPPAPDRSASAAAVVAPAAPAPAAHDTAPPSSDAAPPSSTSAVVAPKSATGSAPQPHPLALPHALTEPALGLSGKLAAARKKVEQALPTLLLASAAGLLGSGRAPALLDAARQQLVVWLTPSGDRATAARGTTPASTNTPGTTTSATASSSSPSSNSPANAPSSTTPHA